MHSGIDNRLEDIKSHLVAAGIYPTRQRREIAKVLFERHQHLTADEVYDRMGRASGSVSRATVYNTLNLFTEKGLLREIFVDASRTFYDTNTQPHYHLYNVDTGHLIDIEAPSIGHHFARELPEGLRIEGIDIVIRVRKG